MTYGPPANTGFDLDRQIWSGEIIPIYAVMKKLLLVTDAWAPQTNGVVTTLVATVAELRNRGIDVTIVHPGMFKRVISLPLYPEVRIALFPGRRMRQIFKQEHPEYVHIATEATLGLAARRECRSKHLPFTTSYHTHFPLYVSHYLRFGRLVTYATSRYLRWFHSASKTVLVCTQSLKSLLEVEGYTRVEVWPLGVDTEKFIRNESGTPRSDLERPIFICFGRVAREKNVEEFLATKLSGTKLVIGDGPQRVELERRYGRETLFVGYKRGQELVDWLSLGDVCVLPSRTETFGLVALEALACGMPVAAHDVMGPRDIITPGVDGMLGEDLAQAAFACLSLSRDECRKKALKYSWKASTDVFLNHIEEGS